MEDIRCRLRACKKTFRDFEIKNLGNNHNLYVSPIKCHYCPQKETVH